MVYLVGAGPGDPSLMTLKGRALLSACGALVYDHLASRRFLEWVPSACRKIYVGKQAGHHSMKQDEINAVLVELALSGLTVVRLKGGDPFVFGRGGEEIQALEAHGIPYETVPGVTSAIAVPECAGIPVTHRGVSRSFHVITGHTLDGKDCLPPEFETYGSLPGTLVFLMGLGQLPAITARLIGGGMAPDTPAAVIEKGTLPDQKVVRAPLSGIHAKVMEEGIGTPAVIVVGETASFHMNCDMKCSFTGPLAGYRIGMIGTRHFTDSLGHALEQEGGEARPILEMEVISHAADPAMQEAYRNLSAYTWLIFTSANGVRLFFQGMRQAGRDYRSLGHVKFAVIGDGTGRELANFGFRADYMPDSFCAEALAQGLASVLTGSDRILIARSRGGSPVLTRILEEAGLVYDDIALYQVEGRPVNEQSTEDTEGQADAESPEEEGFDYITFASASGVRAYLSSGLVIKPGQRSGQTKFVCIGDITAEELKKHGTKADITAGTYHIQGLVQAIVKDAISRKTEGPASV